METSRTKRFAKFLEEGGEKHLSEREKVVAGLLASGKSLEEAGEDQDVTRERIRQISDRINRIIKRVEKEKSTPTRYKEPAPKEMSDRGLMVNLLSAARLAWEVRLRQDEKTAKSSLEYKKERRLQRELMRRLALKNTTSVTVFTLADGVGTTKIVGPFSSREEANEWRNEFWDLFGKRFGEDRITPVDQIRTFEEGDKLISPEEFIKSLPDQQSEAEFFL